MKKVISVIFGFLLVLSFTTTSYSRDQIKIVGSSTVYPYATVVAEKFGKTGKFKTPVIESTGTGGGMKLFCAGVGVNHPDVTNASRALDAFVTSGWLTPTPAQNNFIPPPVPVLSITGVLNFPVLPNFSATTVA